MNVETNIRFVRHAWLALIISGALAGQATGVFAQETPASQTPISTPELPPGEYYELVPTPTPIPEPTPIPIRRLASATQTIPVEQLTRADLMRMLKELHSKQEFTVADSLKAVEQASLQVACTIYYEAGRDTKWFKAYDPYILDGPDIDHAFNFGIGQLSPDGKLIEFYRLGYTNPFDPYQVVNYMNAAFARQQQWHWGPVELGLC